MEKNPVLSTRLEAIATLVCRRPGDFIADIGTDHALLPISLVMRGAVRGAVASDVARGPVERARAAVKSYQLQDKITVCMTDGLQGIEVYHPDTIIIAGMGGELIASILQKAPFVASKGCRLLLQPMTHAADLRRFLTENGFSIVEEALPLDGKRYEVIAARYSGEVTHLTLLEAIVGPCNLARNDEATRDHVKTRARVLRAALEGRRRAVGVDLSADEALLSELEGLLSGSK